MPEDVWLRTSKKYARISQINEDFVEPFGQVTVNARISVSAEKVAVLFDPNRMLKTWSCEAKIAMGLPSCLWKAEYAMLYTGATRNLIRNNAIDAFWGTFINRIALQGLRSPAGTLLRDVGRFPLVTQTNQQIHERDYVNMESFVENILLRITFIGDIIKAMNLWKHPRCPIGSLLTVMLGTGRRKITVEHVNDQEEASFGL